MWHVFRLAEVTVFFTVLAAHFTVISRTNYRVLHTIFSKTPCKNTLFPLKKPAIFFLK
jgi:hypothetical protein